ncbi:MAG: preprotein translocase subunit SecG [Verrucomicrobia bacterium GWF2_51_19]|nr:MAG: preprotein translocase subunit SecG [Verrucomicrobia bacterium GWF2_51_19]
MTFGLLALSAFIVLIILMQRPSANAGMGAALGGGAAESAFGGEATHVLTRWTIYGLIAFFVLSFSLSLIYISREKRQGKVEGNLPVIQEKIPEKTPEGALTDVK